MRASRLVPWRNGIFAQPLPDWCDITRCLVIVAINRDGIVAQPQQWRLRQHTYSIHTSIHTRLQQDVHHKSACRPEAHRVPHRGGRWNPSCSSCSPNITPGHPIGTRATLLRKGTLKINMPSWMDGCLSMTSPHLKRNIASRQLHMEFLASSWCQKVERSINTYSW